MHVNGLGSGQDEIEFGIDGTLVGYNLPLFQNPNLGPISSRVTNPPSQTSASITLQTPPAPATAVTPEPSSLVLLGTGVFAVGGIVRKRFA